MHYSHNVEKATELAGQSLNKIDELGLAPTPEVFEMWYVYFGEMNAEITRAIDIMESANQEITQERCKELHERFLGEKNEGERVRQAGDQINQTIRGMSGMVEDVKSATAQYSSSLSEAKDKLNNDMSKSEIEAVLADVMDDTQDVLSHNKKLEEELSRSSQVMDELRRDLEMVRKEAMTDALTGLANRKAFDSEISHTIAEAGHDGVTFSLMMMDIDHFKSFNDNFGHQVGDQVLRLVALTLIEGVKGRDIATRYGGEEFAIILPETTMKQALHVGEALRKAVAGKDIINRGTGDKMGKITMSGGIAEFVAGENAEDLVARADAALYTAKHNGRNQFACAPTPRKAKRD